jgi:hypothetical protein
MPVNLRSFEPGINVITIRPAIRKPFNQTVKGLSSHMGWNDGRKSRFESLTDQTDYDILPPKASAD